MIEVIVAVTIVALVMLPVTATVIEYIREAAGGDLLATAVNFAKREIGIVNNLAFNDSTLAVGYDHLYSPYISGYPFELRRTVTSVTDASGSGSNLKQAAIRVYPIGFAAAGGCGGAVGGCAGGGGGGGGCGGGGGENPATNQLLEVVTYVANNVTFGTGSAGGTTSSTEASALAITGGSFSDPKLINIGIRNTRTTGNITIAALYIWTTSGNKNVTSVVLSGNQTVFSGSVTLPDSQPASPNITLQANNIINYSAAADTTAQITFNNAIGNNKYVYIIFKMSDNSVTPAYSWQR